MSLTDLKRKNPKQIITPVSIDDFIEGANHYALGKASLFAAPPAHVQRGFNKKSAKIYRHATFTFTETCISQLEILSKDTKIAKSRLLRILIQEFSQRTAAEQHSIVHSGEDVR